MRVRDLIATKNEVPVITVPPTADAGNAARLLMHHAIGGLPVVNASGTLVGFLSERDYVRTAVLHPSGVQDLPVEHIMHSPAATCDANDSLTEVTARMTRERLRHVVVLDEGRIAGIVSVGDLVKRRMEELELEAGVLRDYVVAHRASG